MPSKETFVNLSDYPDSASDEFLTLSLDEQFDLEDYHTFTLEATAVKPGVRVISHLWCEQEDEYGGFCEGDIELVRLKMPSEIRWKCQRCGQHGKITGFENGESDLSGLPEEEARQFVEDTYGIGLETGGEESMSFAEFLDLDTFIDEMAKDKGLFLTWLEHLPKDEKERFLEETNINFDELAFGNLAKGLNPNQIYDLLTGEWKSNQGPLKLNKDLNRKDVNESIFFHNARTMLLKAQKEDGLGLTQKGNLQRKPISELIPDCIWPEGYLEEVKRYNKVVNEHDIWLLHTTRILLEVAGLLHKHKGKLRAVKKHAGLSLGSRSGDLYRHLFITYFRKLNISYLSNDYSDFPNVQENVPFALFRLQELADDWISISELKEKIFLPIAYDDILIETQYYMKPEWFVYSLMLKPLELFGLIETREFEKESLWSYHPDQCRKTVLFDRFISVEF